MVIYEAPWKLRDFAGRIGNGWMLSGIGQFHSGLPYTMRVTGSLPDEFDRSGNAIVGLGPGMNGSGGDNRSTAWQRRQSVITSAATPSAIPIRGRPTCGLPNTSTWAKRASWSCWPRASISSTTRTLPRLKPPAIPSSPAARQARRRAGTTPTLNFLTGLKINTKTGLPIPAFGQPLNINGTDFYRERQIQLGLRMRF